MGAWSGATDDYDSVLDYQISASGDGAAGVYHEYGVDSWTGATGFYGIDRRAPLTPEDSKIWVPLYVWAKPSYEDDTMFLSLNNYYSPADRDYLLELLTVPDGVVGAPAVGTVWDLPLDTLFTLELPTFKTDDGLEGYEFSFTITDVPEPATVGLLAGGVVPLLLHRRRRR